MDGEDEEAGEGEPLLSQEAQAAGGSSDGVVEGGAPPEGVPPRRGWCLCLSPKPTA